MSEDFSIAAGKPFAKLFDTQRGQICVTLEVNDDGNAALSFRAWAENGFATFSVEVSGARAPKADRHFVEMFDELDAAKVTSAWDRAFQED